MFLIVHWKKKIGLRKSKNFFKKTQSQDLTWKTRIYNNFPHNSIVTTSTLVTDYSVTITSPSSHTKKYFNVCFRKQICWFQFFLNQL